MADEKDKTEERRRNDSDRRNTSDRRDGERGVESAEPRRKVPDRRTPSD